MAVRESLWERRFKRSTVLILDESTQAPGSEDALAIQPGDKKTKGVHGFVHTFLSESEGRQSTSTINSANSIVF